MSRNKKVVDLHPNLKGAKIDEILEEIRNDDRIDEFVLLGQYKGGEIFIRSFNLTNSDANWIIDQCKLNILGSVL